MGFLVLHLELSFVLLVPALTISARASRRGTTRRGTNYTDATDVMHVSKRLCTTELSGCISDIWGVILNTNQTHGCCSDDTNVYFAHRILLAADKYVSKPHYIIPKPKFQYCMISISSVMSVHAYWHEYTGTWV